MRVPLAATTLLAALALASPAAGAPRVSEFSRALDGAAGRATAASTGVRTVRVGRRFDLVGLRWRGRGTLRGGRIRVRVAGHWRRWVPLDPAGEDAPDGVRVHGSDPVWAGGADALQLRWRSAPTGLRLRFVRVTHRVRPRPRAAAAQNGPPPMVARSEWDPAGQCRPRATPEYGSVQMAFVHHTVSDNDYGPNDTPAIVLAICRYHRDANGWNDIGYNFLVDKYGRLFEGRAGGIDQPVVGAQAQGWNSQSTSVSNIGTFDNVPESDAALDAMARLLAWKLPLHGVPVTGTVTLTSGGGSLNRYPAGQQETFQRISGHRDGGLTECPGAALYAQLPRLRDLAAARAPAVTPAPVASITASAASAAVAYPDPAQLSGVLQGEGAVSVQVRAGTRWITMARAQPGAEGVWSAALPLTRAHLVRALQVLPNGRAGAASAPIALALVPRLQAGAPTRVLRGGVARVSGTIGPHRRALSLSVTRQGRDGRWRLVRRVALTARRGRFAAGVRLVRPALYRLSVRFAGDAETLATSAPDLYVRAVRRLGGAPARRAPGVSGGAAAPAG